MPGKRLRGVYGGPWSRMAGDIELDKKTLDRLGKAMLDAIKEEARKDFAKRSTTPHTPEGIPDSKGFYDSFDFHIVGRSTIEITSSWPVVQQLVEGKGPYPMPWLTRQAGVKTVTMIASDGTVVVRATPLTVNEAWIHPGFARHTFIQRGVRKGRQKMAEIIREELKKLLLSGDPLR